ncbi:MAG: DUF2206 domain-containing protein [Nitrososphaerota archaeon]
MSTVKWKSEFLLTILLLQFVFCAALIFRIAIIRQAIGFFYFTFIPGFIFIKLLRLDKRDGIEILLFSVGFSIAFLMLGGLLINEFLFALGILKPLTPMSLIIIFNSLILGGAFLVHLKSENFRFYRADILKLFLQRLLLLSLPILSITGAMLVNISQNNVALLFMIVIISLLFIFIVFFRDSLLSKLYSVAILMIALALLYHSSFISNYIISRGSDVPVEYFVFKVTENKALWNTSFSDPIFGRINAMLSVTVLPAVYSGLLNINSTWMFKIIYPLLFSLVPLGLYQIWRKYIGEKRAFISAFYFMAYETFYSEMLGLNRQIISELFFVLLLLVILDKKISRLSKIICFTVFSFALITSHYGISEVFLFFISSALFFSFFKTKRFSGNITLSMVVLFFIVMFGWYIFTTKSIVFNSILEYGDYVYRQLGDFFRFENREPEVMRGLGLETPPTVWNAISRAFAYIAQFLIVLGFVAIITKRLKSNYETEYFAFTIAATTLLIALITIPGLANTMNMTRFYHILLFFLAPLCVLGADFISKMVMKKKSKLWIFILVGVLVPYFLFQTEFVYEVTGSYSWSIPLSGYRMHPLRLYGYNGYIDSYSVKGAQWLSLNAAFKNSRIFADVYSRNNVLTTYGLIYRNYVEPLSNVTVVMNGDVVYLSTLNVIENLIPFRNLTWNSSELSLFKDLNLIYSNGGSIIYKK